MKSIPALVFIAAITITACSSSDKKDDTKKDKYEQTKENLEETEKKNPTRFLTVTGHDKRNLLGQTVVKGTLSNTGKVATFKDVEIRLSFYSKTGTLLEEDPETVFESIAPGKSTDFKTKYFAPKGTDSVALKVMGAKSE
ncbi:FxLYD domain-containing protein [Ferruginibacter sp. SUN106]|uniref:FxLYD domain-containing protein n=1 Tax=Ferruginibacter sp. SUN106 TaxID=2978348 RepID=UPI003D35BB0C